LIVSITPSTSSLLVELASDIVAAYVGNHEIGPERLPELIRTVHRALTGLDMGTKVREIVVVEEPAKPTGPLKPAVPIKKSVTPDFIICLEDGKRFKSLKRHLRTHYDMTPDEYREKWGLPEDYPMVAPNYALARAKLAREIGLGQARAAARNRRKEG
jgi:predicted transcriptional regulator